MIGGHGGAPACPGLPRRGTPRMGTVRSGLTGMRVRSGFGGIPDDFCVFVLISLIWSGFDENLDFLDCEVQSVARCAKCLLSLRLAVCVTRFHNVLLLVVDMCPLKHLEVCVYCSFPSFRMGKRAGHLKAQAKSKRRARKTTADCFLEAEPVFDFDDFMGEDSTSFSGSFAASRQTRVGGSAAHKLHLMANYPPGPPDAEGLDCWPAEIALSLGEDLQNGLARFRSRPITFYTDYSGVEMPRWAWERLIDILDAGVAVRPVERWSRTCDIGKRQTEFLIALHLEDGCGCHMPNIIQRLHTKAQKYITAASPAAKDDKKFRAMAHDEILSWLMENRSWAFPPKKVATSYCCIHDKQCPTWPVPVFVDDDGDEYDDSWRVNSSGAFVVVVAMFVVFFITVIDDVVVDVVAACALLFLNEHGLEHYNNIRHTASNEIKQIHVSQRNINRNKTYKCVNVLFHVGDVVSDD